MRGYTRRGAPLPEVSKNTRAAWLAFQRKARANWGGLAVEARADRIVLSGVTVAGAVDTPEAQAAARGQGEEDGGARVFVQSLDFIDQGLTDARAQIFAQRQSERGARPRQQQRLTVAAAAIERVEERDLGWGRELVDVVYRQHGVRGFGQYGSDVGSAKAMGGAAAGLGLG